MLTLLSLALLQDTARTVTPGTGLEWMPIASVVVPAVLLVVIVYLGSSRRV